jgi:formylglycine-generating enzyme required for sulfatase activity
VPERRDGTTSVGSYPAGASPYGVLDIEGNVCQWCADWYDADYYRSGVNYNPKGPVTGQYRVLRGASWFGGKDYPDIFYCASRNFGRPAGVNDRDADIGFRAVVRVDSKYASTEMGH